jgi:hypothetical protein
MCSRAPSLRGRYPASQLLRTQPPPSRLPSLSRFPRLYEVPGSTDFSMGRGRFLQLLDTPLSPCCPYHPAEVVCRLSQFAPHHVAFARPKRARPSELILSRPPVGSLSLRPGDSLTIPRMALSVGFRRLVSSAPATQATGFPTFTPVGLSPTECASLSWTHGPAQRLLTLRPACSPSRLRDPLHQRLRRLRFLCRRSDCYRVERTSSRAGLAPAED